MPPTLVMPPTKYAVTYLQGGLDQLTPNLRLKPGYVREGVNFECVSSGGYARIGGYERFDGRARPSDATYTLVQVVSFTNTPTVGQTLTGDSSGATGTIIAIGANYIALTLLVGTFTAIEVVKVGGTTIGTATLQTVILTSKQNAQYLNLAADVYRALILAVPGSGTVRGVVSAVIGGTRFVWALRDNAGATATVLHVNSGSGWTPVTMFSQVDFTAGGVTPPAEASTLTQGANTATIKRVVHQTGSWAAQTAAGRFIVTTPSPGNFGAGAATIGGINVNLTAIQTAIVFLPGGKFEFDLTNFFGQLTTRRIYGSDGVNKGFEFDGTVLVPISTGAAVDTPKHLRAHQKALVFTIGSSLMISGPGTPYMFGALQGGVEIATGDTITGLLVQPGAQAAAALCVFCRNLSHQLYGKSAANWDLVTFASATGAYDYMTQNLDASYLLDDRGIVKFTAAQEFGNFLQATLTQNIHTFIKDKRALASYACVNKDRSQFRSFFSDGSGLYTTLLNGELLGHMPVQFPNPVSCIWSGENAVGDEETFFGSTNGFVYQLDKGSSFDGENIDGRLMLSWDTMQSPRIIKTMRAGSLEIQGSFYAELSFGYLLEYGSPLVGQPSLKTYESNFSGASNWDSMVWDAFVWDGSTLSPTEVDVRGDAVNIQLIITTTGDFIYPFTLNSSILHYTPRRGIR